MHLSEGFKDLAVVISSVMNCDQEWSLMPQRIFCNSSTAASRKCVGLKRNPLSSCRGGVVLLVGCVYSSFENWFCCFQIQSILIRQSLFKYHLQILSHYWYGNFYLFIVTKVHYFNSRSRWLAFDSTKLRLTLCSMHISFQGTYQMWYV